MSSSWANSFVALTIALLCCAALLGCKQKPAATVTRSPAAGNEQQATPTTVGASADDQSSATIDDAESRASATESELSAVPNDTAAISGDVVAHVEANQTEAAGEQEVVPSDSDDVETTSAQPPSATLPTAERVMLLAPGGPLLIDVILTINGRPHAEVLADVVSDALTEADADLDGRTTWEEVTQNPRMRYGELGNLPSRDNEQRMQLIRMYDMDRNGAVEEREMRRFLTRNAAGSQSFHLRSANYYRDANRWDSAVRLLLDQNADGLLDANEVESSTAKLKARDADDDDVLLMADFIEMRPNDIKPLERRRTDEAESAIHLNDVRDWNQVLYSLEELYSFGRPLQPEVFAREPSFFGELDQDQDGLLTANELARLMELTPHLVLEMAFGEAPEGSSETYPTLRLIGHPRDVTFSMIQSSTVPRLTCAWSDVSAVFFARDGIPRDYLAQAKLQIEQFDGNNDGYLESSEFPEFLTTTVAEFPALDDDENGKIYPEELSRFQERQQAPMRSQLRARAGEDRDALFTALDQDHDGRLTTREISGAPDRIRAMDQDGDGQINASEIPTAMLLGVVRSEPMRDDAIFTPPTAADAARENQPRWFTSMDVNRDGEISRREFLGELEMFGQLDVNGDGFLSVAETEELD